MTLSLSLFLIDRIGDSRALSRLIDSIDSMTELERIDQTQRMCSGFHSHAQSRFGRGTGQSVGGLEHPKSLERSGAADMRSESVAGSRNFTAPSSRRLESDRRAEPDRDSEGVESAAPIRAQPFVSGEQPLASSQQFAPMVCVCLKSLVTFAIEC